MGLANTAYSESGELFEWMRAARRVYFIGICGVSMCVLAQMTAARGYTVSGSDGTREEGAMALALTGIPVFPPSADSPIIDADLAVYTTAVGKDHPEILAARERGIPLVSRADWFAALMQDYRERLGVAGAHGKSTVSAMLTAILAAAGRDPTAVVGAILPPRLDGYRPGGREALVFEACEYQRAFLLFSPTVAVLTNADWDHPDCYRSAEEAQAAFAAYLARPSVRAVVYNADDPPSCPAAAESPAPEKLSFGLSAGADVSAADLSYREGAACFHLTVYGERVAHLRLRVPGAHNLQNALAAAAAALLYGVPPAAIAEALSGFCGIDRRLQRRGEREGVVYYDDYAHHPAEIRTSLAAIKAATAGRVFCLYQPHTYSRTAQFFPDFASALALADQVILVETYAAREHKNEAGSCRALAEAIGKRAVYFRMPETAIAWVRTRVRRGDSVLVMGAGDISSRIFRGELSFL